MQVVFFFVTHNNIHSTQKVSFTQQKFSFTLPFFQQTEVIHSLLFCNTQNYTCLAYFQISPASEWTTLLFFPTVVSSALMWQTAVVKSGLLFWRYLSKSLCTSKVKSFWQHFTRDFAVVDQSEYFLCWKKKQSE